MRPMQAWRASRADCRRRPLRCLHGLGRPPCHLARQAGRARREGCPPVGPAGAGRLPLRDGRRSLRALHRAAAAGPPLRRRRVAAMALQPDLSGLSAAAAMVAQRHHRDRRRHEAARGRGRVRLAPDPRHGRRRRTSSPRTRLCSTASWRRAARTSCRACRTSWRTGSGSSAEACQPAPRPSRSGRDVAVTPGKVVYRNRLIELIQYAPTTEKVRPEPILIVPAWIMKYYILDLSPANSLVRYLIEQGFTVFMISWKNPTAEDRDLGMDDYRTLGRDGRARCGQRHRAGPARCTRSATASAARSCRSPPPPWRATATSACKTVTLLAAQADFREAGELTLFINESQVALSRGPDVAARAISTPGRWPAPSSCCARTTSSGRGSCGIT